MTEPTKPVLDESFDNYIIIDGLPKVDSSKVDKLSAFVLKKFADYNPLPCSVVTDENGASKGFMFMECATPEDARRALFMDGKPLDRAHTFRVNMFNDYESRYASCPEEYVPLDVAESVIPLPYLKTHLLDELGRDQFCIRYDDEANKSQTSIHRFDTYNQNYIEDIYAGEDHTSAGRSWTDLQTQWSPRGSYLVTFHVQGVAVWGGDNWCRVARVSHPLVNRIEFSPCERYILTASHPENTDFLDVRLWEVATGTLIQNFQNIRAELPWPILRFSHDGNVIARTAFKRKEEKDGTVTAVPSGIAFFDIAKRELLGGKPYPVPGIVDFAFSPTQGIVAYCLLGQSQLPSRLIIYDYIQKKVLRDNPTFGVESWGLSWQKSGDILLVSMTRKTDRRQVVHALDAYFLRKKNIPMVEILVDNKPLSVDLDPVNPVMVTMSETVHGHAPKVEFHIYSITDQAIRHTWQETLPLPSNATINNFKTLWSPSGNTLVIATTLNAGIQFFIVDTSKPTPETKASDLELNHGNVITFDSSGRYLAVASTRPLLPPHLRNSNDLNYHGAWRKNIQDTYAIYNFQGDLIYTKRVPKLYQFHWRPFPLIALSQKERTQVANELKSKHWAKYNSMDEKYQKIKKQEVALRRQELKAAWKAFRSQAQREYEATREDRRLLQHGYASDDEGDDLFEIVEVDEKWIPLTDDTQ